jgi:hypothetical protein
MKPDKQDYIKLRCICAARKQWSEKIPYRMGENI